MLCFEEAVKVFQGCFKPENNKELYIVVLQIKGGRERRTGQHLGKI